MKLIVSKSSSGTVVHAAGITVDIDSACKNLNISNNYAVIDYSVAAGKDNSNIIVYGIMPEHTGNNIVISDNYYLEADTNDVVLRASNVSVKVDNLNDLKNALKELTDEEEQLVYNVGNMDDGQYPTHN